MGLAEEELQSKAVFAVRQNGKWRIAHGRWQMADGRWQMADGRWQMADGRAQALLRLGPCTLHSRDPGKGSAWISFWARSGDRFRGSRRGGSRGRPGRQCAVF